MRLIGMLVVAAMLFAPVASAKEITKVTACGSDDCVTTRDPAIRQGLMNGGPPTVPPSADNPVIRLRATISERGQGTIGHFTSWWVPESRVLVSEDGTWMSLSARAERSLQRIARDLAPFPASRMGITVTPSKPAATPSGEPGAASTPWWLFVIVALVAVAGAAITASLMTRRSHDGGAEASPAPPTQV
jgi:hypothetical protein